MDCQTTWNALSALLDGHVSDGERSEVQAHLEGCPDCDLRMRQLARVRSAVHQLPAKAVPPDLASSLRVIASRQRARVLARKDPAAFWRERFHLFFNNLMRPLALPFAGGLASAMVLFGVLFPGMRLKMDPRINDVPAYSQIYTDPQVKEQSPFGITTGEDELVLEVIVDGDGKAVYYSSANGGTELAQNPRLRREVEKDLLFTQFTPATAYGKPTIGKMLLQFTRSKIDVPSKS